MFVVFKGSAPFSPWSSASWRRPRFQDDDRVAQGWRPPGLSWESSDSSSSGSWRCSRPGHESAVPVCDALTSLRQATRLLVRLRSAAEEETMGLFKRSKRDAVSDNL